MEYIKRRATAAPETTRNVTLRVTEIIESVRRSGEKAVRQFSRTLDGYTGDLRVSREVIASAEAALPPGVREALAQAAKNVSTFHSLQRSMLREEVVEVMEGVFAGIRFEPVSSAAIYVPGGRYPLPSTAVMGVVAAREAGVGRIVAMTPPSGPGGPHEIVLGALSMLDVEEVWSIGGAQAIAACAFGIEGMERVDVIAGPGNAYVTEAKRLLFGNVGIDGLAGPSEVTVVADDTARADLVAADLIAQSEHDTQARATLLCLDRELALSVLPKVESLLGKLPDPGTARESWSCNGTVAFCSMEEAASYANSESPEHLVLAVKAPGEALPLFRSFGSAFLGPFTAQAFGDYVAGTNHILPTGGTARFAGGLWTGTFLRPQTFLETNISGARRLAELGSPISEAEGLPGHTLAMELRFGVDRS